MVTHQDQKSSGNGQERLLILREKINGIDAQLLDLLSKRQEIATEVGNIKNDLGIGIFNMAREAEVFRRLTSQSRQHLNKEAIRHIFSEIISAARSVQQPIQVAYLGPAATFSHQAAINLFGHSTSFISAETIEDVFSLVEKGVCQQGVVPIENSYEGSVNTTMDLFFKYDLKICAEVYLRIRHHFLSKANQMNDIKHIYSHPMPIPQCRTWLKANIQERPIIKVDSTALAAKMASEDDKSAAIGSRLAGLTYGLNMIAENIEDQPDNVTRFLVISKYCAEKTNKDKTSLLFFLNHKPGALFNSIEPFSRRNINMTRIESRPFKIKSWEYLFFVDIEGHSDDDNVSQAVKEMAEHCAIMKELGSYPEGGMVWD